MTDGLTVTLLDASILYRVKRNSELMLRCYLTRRLIHRIFTGPKRLAKYPLVVSTTLEGTPRLVRLDLREERMDVALTDPESELEYHPSGQAHVQ
jgi:hypothetical protein